MRDAILSLAQNIAVSGFSVSSELPYPQNDTPLYLQNYKRVYFDLEQSDQDPLFTLLDGNGVVNETITVSAYVTTDAKQLPSNYAELVQALRNIRVSDDLNGYNQKLNTISTEYDNDALVTQVDYVFVKTKFDH